MNGRGNTALAAAVAISGVAALPFFAKRRSPRERDLRPSDAQMREQILAEDKRQRRRKRNLGEGHA